MTVAQTPTIRHNENAAHGWNHEAALKLNHAGGTACAFGGVETEPRPLSHKAVLPVKAELCPMNPPHPSAANRERLLTIMAVCHRLRQPLPPRTRLAPLVGCTTRQLHRYIERLKAEGAVALRRGSRCVHVQEISR